MNENKERDKILSVLLGDSERYIREIFSDVQDLKPSGKGFLGLCPFPDHEDKTPSFSVNVKDGTILYNCFGCGKGGDVFKYVMKKDNIGFYEALKKLGDITGVEINKKKFSEKALKIKCFTRSANEAHRKYEDAIKRKENEDTIDILSDELNKELTTPPKGADLDETFEKYFIEACERVKGELIGLEINNFSELTKKLDGLQDGLYIVGAYSNVGKTAFLTNLFLETIKANPSARVLFYSLDDSKKTIFTRLLAYSINRSNYDNELDGRHTINELKKLKDNETLKNLTVNEYSKLLTFFEEGRLRIYDSNDIDSIEDLEDEIIKHNSDIKFNYPDIQKLVIFIDALYDLPIETEAEGGGIREKNIERATKIKALSTSYGLPILTTAELRKKDSKKSDAWDYEPTIDAIMETGKYIYKADVVFLLSPNFEHYKDEEDFEKARDDNNNYSFYVKFAKNKLSGFKGKLYFNFHTLYNMIIETVEPEKAKREDKPKPNKKAKTSVRNKTEKF